MMPATDFANYDVPQPDLDEARQRYDELLERVGSARDADECAGVVREWDLLLCEFKEWASLTQIRFHQDTRNPEHTAAKKALDELAPRFAELETEMKQALLDSPFRGELEKRFTAQLFAKWECNTKSFAPEIEDDLVAEAKLQSEYTGLTAGAEVEFRGERLTLPELGRFAEDADRGTRAAACRTKSDWYAENAGELDRIYGEQVAVRDAMARKLGYRDFVGLGYQRMSRIGYGQEEVERFRAEVRDNVVPLAEEIAARQRDALGVDELMFWDVGVHSASGNPKPQGDHDWMIGRATEMFAELGHGLDSFFEEMRARNAMDLRSRKGKAGGGFCDFLHLFGFPFIFANFNGTRADVDVFTHEVGHAFQSFSSRKQPVSDLVWPTTEACEIHSMGLEFLTWPYMDKFYGAEAAEELRRVHLSASLQFLPYGVAIDHFQHLVYARPEASPDERNAMWQEVERLYLPWFRYGDLPAESSGRLWQQKQHLYLCPLYYIDYCLALTGALQLWSRARADRERALGDYVRLCELGGSSDYVGLLAAAGLASPFESGSLAQIIADARAYLGLPG